MIFLRLGVSMDTPSQHMDPPLFLYQRRCALDILSECGMLCAKPTPFPMEQYHMLSNDLGAHVLDPSQSKSFIGHMLYLTITRPDFTYFFLVLRQFMQDPCQEHWNATMQVYCHFDCVGFPMLRRSVKLHLVNVGEAPVSLKAQKQFTVSRSYIEVEY